MLLLPAQNLPALDCLLNPGLSVKPVCEGPSSGYEQTNFILTR